MILLEWILEAKNIYKKDETDNKAIAQGPLVTSRPMNRIVSHEQLWETTMTPNVWSLYALMLKSRLLEEAI